MKYFLRIEGVNLDRFVFDTRDLSTIRGGGLLLLHAVDKAVAVLVGILGKDSVSILSTGASSALLEIKTNDPSGDARRVRDALNLDSNFCHATFVVDVVEQKDSFCDDNERVFAANHWRQMQASTLAVPPQSVKSGMPKPACALDGIRPAIADDAHGAPNRSEDKDAFISDSVHARREYGRDAKQRFYDRIINNVIQREASFARRADLQKLSKSLPAFAGDFEAIATKRGDTLSGKLAVFYADGNSFGAKQATHCLDPDRQKAFDQFIRGQREAFLTEFLQSQSADEQWLTQSHDGKKALRFETLLWGGDELMFVMPAALGWRFATCFFKKLGGLNLNQAKLENGAPLAGDEPLTHAASLVFCHHHAPIQRIKRLAKEQMAEFSKETDRSRDSLLILALESFDHLGSSYKKAMRKRYNDAVPLQQLILSSANGKTLGEPLAVLAEHMRALRISESFPRSQLRGLVQKMLAKPDEANNVAAFIQDRKGDWHPPRAFRNSDETVEKLLREQLLPLFASPAALWIQLEELWDYTLP